MKTDASVALLAAMANEKRLTILSLLVEKEIAVTELAALVELSQSALSQHLAKLRGLHLVDTRRSAQTIYYSCNAPAVRAILNVLDDDSRERAELAIQ